MSTRSVMSLLMLGATACAAGLAGCRSAPAAAPTPVSPTEHGPRNGLELAWWVMDEVLPGPDAAVGPPGPSATQLFERYASRPVPAPASVTEAWRASGLRLYAIPVAELEGLRRQVHLVGPLQQQWIGQSPAWIEAARGPKWTRPTSVVLDNGELRLPGGSVRLLLRTWIAPAPLGSAPEQRAVIQVEIAPQHVPLAEDRLSLQALEGARPVGREDEGAIFERLLLETALNGEDALVIVPEAPHAPEAEPAPASLDDLIAGVGGAALGPPVPALPTLGEAMLTDRSHAAGTTRAVIVLTPRLSANARPSVP